MMELVFNGFVGIILLVFLVGSFFIHNDSVASDVLMPQGFPLIFSIVGLILLGASTAGMLLRKKETNTDKKNEAVRLNREGGKRTGLVILLLFLYIVLINYTGFILITLFFIFLSLFAIGYRNRKMALVFAVLLTAMLVIVFGKVFFIALPRGAGILRELSFYIY
jgi:hypothetical protein